METVKEDRGMDKASNLEKIIIIAGLPYFLILIAFEMLPYWNFSRKKIDEFTVEDVTRMFIKRVNIAFVAFITVMLLIYWMFRGVFHYSGWYDLFMLCVGSLLMYGGLVSRAAQIDYYVDEFKTKNTISASDYFEW